MIISKQDTAPLAFRQMQIRERGGKASLRRLISMGDLLVPEYLRSWRKFPRQCGAGPGFGNPPTRSQVPPKPIVKHKDDNDGPLLKDASDLPSETLEQTFAKTSGELFEHVPISDPISGRGGRRASRSLSSTPLAQPGSAFVDTTNCQHNQNRARASSTASATTIKQISTNCPNSFSENAPNLAIDAPLEIISASESCRPKIYLVFRPEDSKETIRGSTSSKSRKSGKAAATAKENRRPAGSKSSSSRLPLLSCVGGISSGAGNGRDEDDEDPKKPLKNDHDDSDESSDNSEKRRRRRMIRKGKRTQGKQINPGNHNGRDSQSSDSEVREEMSEEHFAGRRTALAGSPERRLDSRDAVDRWVLGVPSPFTSNEINDATRPNLTPPSAGNEEFPTSSRNFSTHDHIQTKRSETTVRGHSQSNPASLEKSKQEPEKPRRNSFVETFIANGHPRVGTRFPNMALEGFGRACGMPTTAQLRTTAGKRYTFFDRSGQKIILNPLPIPTKISERSHSTPRDTSFPGPSRKQLLVDAAHNSAKVLCAKVLSLGQPEATRAAAAGDHPPRGRQIDAIQPTNTAREESERRPGWRKTALVQAHVITGENTCHTPWVASLRPLELERSGFPKESGYGPLPESSNDTADDSSEEDAGVPSVDESTTSSSAEQSADVSMEEASSIFQSAQHLSDTSSAEAPAIVPSTQQPADVLMVEEPATISSAEESADVPTEDELSTVQSAQQLSNTASADAPAMNPSAQEPADIPMVEESATISNAEQSADVPMIEEFAMIESAQQLSDTPIAEAPAVVPRTQPPARSVSAIVDSTRRRRASLQITQGRRVSTHVFAQRVASLSAQSSATASFQRSANRLPSTRNTVNFAELTAENREGLGRQGPGIVVRPTGDIHEGPQVAHIERASASPQRRSPLLAPTASSTARRHRMSMRMDAPSPAEDRAPRLLVGCYRREDGQARSDIQSNLSSTGVRYRVPMRTASENHAPAMSVGSRRNEEGQGRLGILPMRVDAPSIPDGQVPEIMSVGSHRIEDDQARSGSLSMRMDAPSVPESRASSIISVSDPSSEDGQARSGILPTANLTESRKRVPMRTGASSVPGIQAPSVISAHRSRNEDNQARSSILPSASSTESWNRIPMQTDAPSVPQGQAPAMSAGNRRIEDGQARSGSAPPVRRSPPRSKSSDESYGDCGCFPLGSLTCGLFQGPRPPLQDPLASPTPPVLPEPAVPLAPAIPLSLLNQTVQSRAADSNRIGVPSTGAVIWRQIDWSVHSTGSRTVGPTPESGTRATSAATLNLAQDEDSPSPRTKVVG
ncbi:hypothetical protein MMC07_000129 [Pseudocyphellaria aurata]|nr:hypothetical protein [Pseudocyphellaria aurata]